MFPFCNPYLPSFSHPENPENQCDSILATSLEMQVHHSQSSREKRRYPIQLHIPIRPITGKYLHSDVSLSIVNKQDTKA